MNKICDFVEKEGIRGPILIFIGWIILFFFAVEIRAAPARSMLPLAAFLAIVYLAVWTYVLLKGDGGKKPIDTDDEKVSITQKEGE